MSKPIKIYVKSESNALNDAKAVRLEAQRRAAQASDQYAEADARVTDLEIRAKLVKMLESDRVLSRRDLEIFSPMWSDEDYE